MTTIDDKYFLSNADKDALGEIGNICMGTSATTMSTLLGKRVTITTPEVHVSSLSDYLVQYERPVVLTEVSYTQGLDGSNSFLIKKEDALFITKLLMSGGDESASEEEFEEFYLSAISEVMNQMVGSSSTALAQTLNMSINIAPPVVKELTDEEREEIKKRSDEILIIISFRMEIEDVLVSNIMQIMPFDFGKKLAHSLIHVESTDNTKKEEGISNMAGNVSPADVSPSGGFAGTSAAISSQSDKNKNINLKEVKFQTFDTTSMAGSSGGNIDLIIDVPLQVTVVLGKSRKSIKEILDMGMGSVVVLDRIAGEMVDVMVNGKLFARGEVIVINDNYGVRITEIVGKPMG